MVFAGAPAPEAFAPALTTPNGFFGALANMGGYDDDVEEDDCLLFADSAVPAVAVVALAAVFAPVPATADPNLKPVVPVDPNVKPPLDDDTELAAVVAP